MSSDILKKTIIFIIICALFHFAKCWNFTENLLRYKRDLFNTKRARLISFDATDEDLKLDLEFSIPFIQLPVKKSMSYATNFVANVNLPSLILTGLMVFVSAVAIPTIVGFFDKKLHPYRDEINPTKRRIDKDSTLWNYLTRLDGLLLENDLDTTSCIQKAACSLVETSRMNVFRGNGSSVDKIIDGLSSNEWFLERFSDTPLYSALRVEQKAGTCRDNYSNCRFTHKQLNKLVREIYKYLGDY